MFSLTTPLTYLDPPGQMMSLSSTCNTMAWLSYIHKANIDTTNTRALTLKKE